MVRVASVAVALITVAGCSDWSPFRPPTPPELFTIRIDSLRYSPEAVVGDTLIVEFWGYIGPSTCYQFFGFHALRDSFELDVTAVGAVDYTAHVCGPALQYLRGEELEVFPLYEGDLILVVQQPDSSALVETVRIAGRGLGGARPN